MKVKDVDRRQLTEKSERQ